MSDLTMGSLFSGQEGFGLAGILSNIDLKWSCEVDPNPMKVLRARFPNIKHYNDVSSIKGDKIETVDIITFGSPCFAAGSLVTTDRGLIPIEEVKIGDKVLTHTNQFKTVIDWGKTSNKKILKLSAMGAEEILATPNHKFYVRQKYRKYKSYYEDGARKRKAERLFKDPEWKELQEITRDDYLGIAINQKSENPHNLTEEECWLIGRYVADGYIRDSKRANRKNSYNHQVIFCVGKHKTEEFENNVKTYYAGKRGERTVYKYIIINERLMSLCKQCGKRALNKEFPPFIINLPVELLQKVIEGYMSGDGSLENSVYSATSVSKRLLYSLAQAIMKVYKRPYSISKFEVSPTTTIEGRTVNQHTQYQIRYKLNKGKQDKAFYEEGYIWCPIREIVEYGNKDVYNITVEDDNSYCVQNIIVHNCQDLSLAGKRVGLQHSKMGSTDTSRSGLFFEALRIIEEMRNQEGKPRYALWENVFGAFSSSKGEDFRRVLEEFCQVNNVNANIPKLDKWTPNGEIIGDNFSLAWRTFDAQYWGVPQRRRRIYLLADFDGDTAGKIMFRNEGIDFHSNLSAWQSSIANTTLSIEDTINKIKQDSHKTVNLEKNDIKSRFSRLILSEGEWGFDVPVGYIIGEKPFYQNKSKLSSILQLNVPSSYFLSPTACDGILRRALERGKQLPLVLQKALENQSKNNIANIEDDCSGIAIGHALRLNGSAHHEISGTLLTSTGDNIASVIGKPSTYRKSSHAKSPIDGQGWEEADVNDTLNVFDSGENRTPTLVVQSMPIENHPNDSRIKIKEDNISQTLSSRMGTGGNNTPLVMEKVFSSTVGSFMHAEEDLASTLMARDYKDPQIIAVEGNGGRPSHKGNGYSEEDVSYTLNTVEQHAVAYGISSKDSNGMKSDNPDVGFYETDTSRTLDLNGGNPACNQGGVAIVEYQDVVGTLAHDDYKGAGNQYVGENKCIVVEQIEEGLKELNSTAKHQQDLIQSANGCSRTLACGHHGSSKHLTKTLVKEGQNYYVRRLTPIECERLQGMPDGWCYNVENDSPTQEDIEFWDNQFEMYRKVISKGKKRKTEKQIRAWLSKPLSDSAIYKIQGNGIALPNAWYVLEGISNLHKE